MNPDSAYRQLKKFLTEAGLPNIRFHDLRHTFSTHALFSGVDAKTLAGILGHTILVIITIAMMLSEFRKMPATSNVEQIRRPL